MRTRYRYDPDLDAVVEIRNNYFTERGQSAAVISDDLGQGVNGVKHIPSGTMIDSKSGHYRENKARGLVHVGNEKNFATKQETASADSYVQATKDAAEQISGDYNGTRGWLQRQREEGRNIRWDEHR